jgi:pilus assembly protein CpaB
MIVAIFAVLFGLVGAYAVRRYLEPPAAPAAAPEQPVTVPLASIDLNPGRPLRLGDIVLVPMLAKERRERGLPDDVMSNPSQIIGRILRSPMKKGEPFQPANLYPEGSGPSLAERLKPGQRAVTISIAGTGVVDGLAMPGSIVDVLFRTAADAQNGVSETTVTLLEGVEILAVGDNWVPGAQNRGVRGTVTLAVSPTQASALKIAEGRGEFSLSMRSPDDGTLAGSARAVTLDGLLNLPRREKPFTTDIYRGGSRQTLTFERGNVVKESFGGLPVADNAHPHSNGNVAAAGSAHP